MNSDKKPTWWPENPYPENIFTMTEEEFISLFPDHALRTRIAGFMARTIWSNFADQHWEKIRDIFEIVEYGPKDGAEVLLKPEYQQELYDLLRDDEVARYDRGGI